MSGLEEIEKKIIDLTEDIFTQEGVELVELELEPSKSMLLLRFLVGKQNGISIQECTKVNRRIGHILEVADIIDGKYTLEVSSPGADRLLKTRTDFWLNTGQRIRIVLNEAVRERKTYVGLLKSVADDTIIIEPELGPDIVIALDNIFKAKQEVRMR